MINCLFEVKLQRKLLGTRPRNQTTENMLRPKYDHLKLVKAVTINSFIWQKTKHLRHASMSTVKTVQGA